MSIAASFEFVDHSEAIKDLLYRKLRALVGAAAERLADDYKIALQRETAPPHSEKGQIPFRYLGHKPRGFGPLNGYGEINNTTSFGFSSNQTDYLATYIHGVSGAEGQKVLGLVGFIDSHVTRRDQNYLIWHDRNGRPWVMPVYRKSKSAMISEAKAAFEGAV